MATPAKTSFHALADAFPLVGRATELATLRHCLASALAGRGGLVLVGGEAGIGKTALLDELAIGAREQSALVLAGHAYDLSDTPPYGPWTECLAQCRRVPELPPPPAIIAALVVDGSSAIRASSQVALFIETSVYLAQLATLRPADFDISFFN